MPVLKWCLEQHISEAVNGQWADFRRLPRQRSLEGKVSVAMEVYPCDLLFVHRDAESHPPAWRRDEIGEALQNSPDPYVPVIPVRMTEAWFLFDELSIRLAAGNPNGTEELNLPAIQKLESISDPKTLLHHALVEASGLSSRRRSGFQVHQRVHRIPTYIDDYSALKALPAFQTLQEDIRSALQT